VVKATAILLYYKLPENILPDCLKHYICNVVAIKMGLTKNQYSVYNDDVIIPAVPAPL
jgi:hypothetical protein